MNRKELKKILIDKANDVEVKDFSAEILSRANTDPVEKPEVTVRNDKKTVKNPPRRLLPAFGIAFAAIALIVCASFLTSLYIGGGHGGGGHGGGTPGVDEVFVGKTEKVMAREMIALGNVVAGVADGNAAFAAGIADARVFGTGVATAAGDDDIAENENQNDDDSDGDDTEIGVMDDESKKQIAKSVNNYLITGLAFLKNENVEIKCVKNRNKKYDYEIEMTVFYTDISNYKYSYVIYYTETEDRETAGKTDIKGLFVRDGKEYPVTGKHEREADEVEMKLEIRLDDNSVISVSNENAIGEYAYEYEYFSGDISIREVSIDVSTEGSYKTIEIEITENGVETQCEFEFVDDTHIKCTYTFYEQSEEKEIEIDVEIAEDAYIYSYGEDSHQIIKIPK